MATRKLSMLLGKVKPSNIRKAVYIDIPRKVLDENLNMYFSEWTSYYAFDPSEKCKPGDIVFIKELIEPLSKEVTHEVKEIVFPRGDISDPITGEKCVGSMLVKDINYTNRFLGGRPNPSSEIEHSDKDFTPRETYPKHIDVKLVD